MLILIEDKFLAYSCGKQLLLYQVFIAYFAEFIILY